MSHNHEHAAFIQNYQPWKKVDNKLLKNKSKDDTIKMEEEIFRAIIYSLKYKSYNLCSLEPLNDKN